MKTVALTACHHYDYPYREVRRSIEEGIELMGGLSPHVLPGERILLKANLLMKKKPEEATTTHPVFMKALADIFLDYGCSVLIADSPGGPFNEAALRGVYKACGYEAAFADTPVVLNYDVSEKSVYNEACKVGKTLTVIGVLDQVDKVISVSKLKTHGMMKFTGAVKNMFGTIPGLIKAEYHFKLPKADDFAEMLVDVCVNAKPVLSFMDGIVGMEGSGPSAGDPREIGAVLVSESPYHLDLVASGIVGIAPQEIPTMVASEGRGLVKLDGSDTQVVGQLPADFGIQSFKSPNIRSVELLDGMLPPFAKRWVNRMMTSRPVFSRELCIGCGECDRSCPPKAITMVERFPSVDLDKCIRCYCCQELCPKKAVDIHRPWLLKKLVRL